MKTTQCLLFLTFALTACTDYQPSKASCFSFVSRGSTSSDCSFEPLARTDFLEAVQGQ